jgi:6-phosphogluconolactonase
MSYYVYVSISEEDRLSVFTMDPETGKLQAQGSVSVTGRPAPLAVDPERRFLYVGRRASGSFGIASFRIDHSTGGLLPVGSIPLEGNPVYIATDRKGKFLLSAYYYQGKVAVHPIGDNGAVSDPPVEWLDTDRGAHAIQTDPSNRFAFAPHIAGNGPNAIFQFKFDQVSGHLTPNSPPRVTPKEPEGPRHICFHPKLDILYSSNEQGSSVTAYSFDRSQGTLTPFQTVSTLPDGYKGKNSCSKIQISPSGEFLYAPNRGHNSIACFSVEASTGRLTSMGQAPSEAIPRAFSLDPEGKFLFAAGLESGRLASYRINAGTGALEPLEVYNVGQGPMWVLTIRVG